MRWGRISEARENLLQAAGQSLLLTRLVRLRQLVSSFSLPCLLQLVPSNFNLALEIFEPCIPDVFHTEQQVGFVQRRPSARLYQIRKVAERCPHLKILHFYNNPDYPVDNFGFLDQFLSLTCLTLSGGRYSVLSRLRGNHLYLQV